MPCPSENESTVQPSSTMCGRRTVDSSALGRRSRNIVWIGGLREDGFVLQWCRRRDADCYGSFLYSLWGNQRPQRWVVACRPNLNVPGLFECHKSYQTCLPRGAPSQQLVGMLPGHDVFADDDRSDERLGLFDTSLTATDRQTNKQTCLHDNSLYHPSHST